MGKTLNLPLYDREKTLGTLELEAHLDEPEQP
jgi:hypothetical protein